MRRQHNEAAINNMIKNLTVKSHLAEVIGLLLLPLGAIGFAGLLGMVNAGEGVRTVYKGCIIPVDRLSSIESKLAENRLPTPPTPPAIVTTVWQARGIAGQANLMALNAAIKATHASAQNKVGAEIAHRVENIAQMIEKNHEAIGHVGLNIAQLERLANERQAAMAHHKVRAAGV